MVFKKGNKVALRDDGGYAGQIELTGDNKGTIRKISGRPIDGHCYEVRFSNGYSNQYRAVDLKLLGPAKMKVINKGGKLIFEAREEDGI